MPSGISAINTVVAVGVVEGLELFIRTDQGIYQINGILVVDIIIPCAVNQ